MSRSKSTYVCQRCGCAVYFWRGEVWKHAAGRNVRSCRMTPVVMERAAYDAWMTEQVEGMRIAIARRLNSVDVPRETSGE